MFGRGSWAVFGVRAASQATFETTMVPPLSSDVSQMTAVQTAKQSEVSTWGILPYSFPRADEDPVWSSRVINVEDLRLGPQQFGLWFVLNGFEDVTDPKSKLEGLSYETSAKPYKFLKKPEKEYIESMVKASAVMSRKQFPVLIDFVGERVYAETTNADEIGAVRQVLTQLGCEVYSISWQFGGFDWPSQFLNHIWENNKFHKPMQERAEELKRFSAEEVEKLDDKLLESIVTNFFALSELETGQWAGLSTPARIKFYQGAEPSSESSVSTAFTLKDMMDKESSIVSASVTFQNLDSKFNKKDEEIQYRTDLFTIDINDKINIQDAGCATLRGFDMPQYKKDMKQAGKDRGALTVKDYWMEWLIGMKTAVHTFVENVIETLLSQAPKKEAFGMQVYEHEEAPEQGEGTAASE